MVHAKQNTIAIALILAALCMSLPNIAAAAPKGTNSVVTAVSGTASGTAVPTGSSFVGTLTLTGFSAANGVLNAVGTLTGNIVGPGPNGAVLQSINQVVTLPLAVNGSCPILNLTLGPLDLNLLGLTIHLNQVVLNIVAESGAGNLLGNLLCAVANLLNNGGPIQTLLGNLVTLLNNILAAL